MVGADVKYYQMSKIRRKGREKTEPEKRKKDWEKEQKQIWTEAEVRYGKLLLEGRNPVLREFLERERRIKQQILSRLETEDSGRIRERRKAVKEELECTEKGLSYYAVQRDYTGD